MVEDNLAGLLAVVVAAGAFTLPLVELIKAQGLPARFAPAASLVSGLIIVGLLALADVAALTFWEGVLAGLVSGMSAAGVYSGGRALAGRS
jgi:hypothetical protein